MAKYFFLFLFLPFWSFDVRGSSGLPRPFLSSLKSTDCPGLSLILFRLQGKTDRSAHIHLAPHMHALPVGFNDMFTNCQPQPRAADVAAASPVCAVEALKYPRKVLFGDPDPVIADFKKDMFF